MKNTFKRIVAIALVVLMCASTVVPAFAAGNVCPGYGNTHNTYNCTYVEADTQEATCSNDGHVTGKCVTCGTIFSASQTKALGHTWEVQPATCGNDYKKKCTVCEAEETIPNSAVNHLFTAWTLNEGVTECKEGERVTKTCVYCGYARTTQITAEGHVFEVVSYTEPATCKDLGVAQLECTVVGCDATKEAVVLPTYDDHLWSDWTASTMGTDLAAKEPTCSESGRKTKYCTNCEITTVVARNKIACTVHVEAGETAPNCELTGVKRHYWCADCDNYYDPSKVTLGTDYRDTDGDGIKEELYYTVDKNATGFDKTAIVDKAWTVIPSVHSTLKEDPQAIVSWAAPTCKNDGYIELRCYKQYQKTENGTTTTERCNYKETVKIPAFAGHVYYNDVKDVDAKATLLVAFGFVTEDGIKLWSDSKIEKEWEKLGEVGIDTTLPGKEKVWTNFVPADCEENATVSYKCLNCYYFDAYKKDNSGSVVYDNNGNPVKVGYVFSCNTLKKNVTLEGEDFDALGHKYAETYPLSSNLKHPTVTVATPGDDGQLGTTDDGTEAANAAGLPAHYWVDGKKADCTNGGDKVYYCITEYKTVDANGNTVIKGCEYGANKTPETDLVRVNAYGHDFQVIAATDVVAGETYDDPDDFDNDGSYTKAAADLVTWINNNVVKCFAPNANSDANGKAVKVCSNPGCYLIDGTVVTVTSTGTEHVWNYYDMSQNATLIGDINAVYASITNNADNDALYDANYYECESTITVLRMCTISNCPASIGHETYVIPAKGHKFPDTSKEDVLQELAGLKGPGSTNRDDPTTTTKETNYPDGTFTLVSDGTCEKGAMFAIKCEKCNRKQSYEYTEGFKMGHDKVYLVATAKAPTCTADGYSNKWYCKNEICEYYAHVDSTGALKLGNKVNDPDGQPNSGDETPIIIDVNNEAHLAMLDSDVKYGSNHKIWDATLGQNGNFRKVKYTDVADTKISGAQNVGVASKQYGPEEGVKTIAIEGTTVVWVYMYDAKDHTEADVQTGGFYCAACNNNSFNDATSSTTFNANVLNSVYVHNGVGSAAQYGYDREAYTSNKIDSLSKPVDCAKVGYAYYPCDDANSCFCVVLDNFTPPTKHSSGLSIVTFNTNKQKFEVKDNAETILAMFKDLLSSDPAKVVAAKNYLVAQNLATLDASGDVNGGIAYEVIASAKKGNDYVKDNGLTYVEAGCLVAGYAIDKCLDCDLVITVEIPTVSHQNKNGEVLVDSCVNYVTNRVCKYCQQTIARGHIADANGICKVCGLVDQK